MIAKKFFLFFLLVFSINIYTSDMELFKGEYEIPPLSCSIPSSYLRDIWCKQNTCEKQGKFYCGISGDFIKEGGITPGQGYSEEKFAYRGLELTKWTYKSPYSQCILYFYEWAGIYSNKLEYLTAFIDDYINYRNGEIC